ncbi:alpha/beta fold hydrolase [Ferrovibrio xuzhouensis]|uniref:Alpha/beta fold hydrolase n=1 Tax=Ferrovibrio xuzhouensis TaxID=1576914 RepID=A0ABV7VGY6_9PROT
MPDLRGHELTPRLLNTAAGRISYLEAGSGTPLVLLHGIGSAARAFRDQLAALSAGYRVTAWDAPGYGDSTNLPMPQPGAGDYAAALAAFLDALGVQSCHLLGHSLGALVAARFAAAYPQRVRSLTLASIAVGNAHLSDTERQDFITQRLADLIAMGPRAMAEKRGPRLLGPQATPAMIARVVDTMGSVRPDGYTQAVNMLATGDVKADVARFAASLPLQIIYGSDDVITPPERNRAVVALRPQAPVHEIAGAGHAVYLEKPEAFNAALGGFIAGLSPAGEGRS